MSYLISLLFSSDLLWRVTWCDWLLLFKQYVIHSDIWMIYKGWCCSLSGCQGQRWQSYIFLTCPVWEGNGGLQQLPSNLMFGHATQEAKANIISVTAMVGLNTTIKWQSRIISCSVLFLSKKCPYLSNRICYSPTTSTDFQISGKPLSYIYIGEVYLENVCKYALRLCLALLALATFGDAAQVQMILFVLCYLRCRGQVQWSVTIEIYVNVADGFTEKCQLALSTLLNNHQHRTFTLYLFDDYKLHSKYTIIVHAWWSSSDDHNIFNVQATSEPKKRFLTFHFITWIHLWILTNETAVRGCQVNLLIFALCFVCILATMK